MPEHLFHEDLEKGLLWRLPPTEGIVNADLHLLWNREQRMTMAETVFLESFRHCLAQASLI